MRVYHSTTYSDYDDSPDLSSSGALFICETDDPMTAIVADARARLGEEGSLRCMLRDGRAMWFDLDQNDHVGFEALFVALKVREVWDYLDGEGEPTEDQYLIVGE